jgi:hypothetical protein
MYPPGGRVAWIRRGYCGAIDTIATNRHLNFPPALHIPKQLAPEQPLPQVRSEDSHQSFLRAMHEPLFAYQSIK